MKDIIFILPSLSGGGAERVIYSLSEEFINKYNDNVSICLLRNDSIEYEINNKIKIIKKYVVSNSKFKKIKTIMNLRKLMVENKNSIFISFLTNENIYLTFSSLGIKTHIIVSERNDPYLTIKGSLKKKIVNWLYGIKQCKSIVFQTEGAKSFYSVKNQRKGVIISNPVKSNLPERCIGERTKEIVTFARLEPQKNYPLLIKSFKKFSIDFPDYTLGIYGKGSMEQSLKELARELKIDKKVKFYGFDSRLHEKIVNSAMFVLSSDYEGLSNSMLEAMAMGLPCVCTDCSPGGARMFIKNNYNGILVKVNDIQGMYEGMCKIASDNSFSNEISKNAYKIRNELTLNKIAEQWEELFRGF